MSLEIAVLAPVMLLLTFAVVQMALWSHARAVARAAAQEGAAAAAAYGGTTKVGSARAQKVATTTGAGTLTGVRTTAVTRRNVVSVTVTGRALSVVPGFAGLAITEQADAARERLTVGIVPR